MRRSFVYILWYLNNVIIRAFMLIKTDSRQVQLHFGTKFILLLICATKIRFKSVSKIGNNATMSFLKN